MPEHDSRERLQDHPPLQSALDFLHWLRPDGPWLLIAIPPDGSPIATTAHKLEQAETFIRQHDGKRNLYFSVNPTRAPR